MRDMIIVWIQKHMINQGIYFDDNVYNDCALAALGKEYLVQAKKSLPRFTDCLSMAKEASKNFRSKASKRTKAEVVCQFTGDGRLFSNSGDHNKEVGLALLEGYRQITLATWPAPKSDVLRDMTSPNDHNTIRHLTAHQIAYVGVKARSLLRGELHNPCKRCRAGCSHCTVPRNSSRSRRAMLQ